MAETNGIYINNRVIFDYDGKILFNYTNTKKYYIDAGTCSSVLYTSDYESWGWGSNDTGRLGVGNIISYSNPVTIINKNFININYNAEISCGLDKDGQIWCWGRGDVGSLGDNSITAKCTPVSIHGTRKTFCKISSGSYMCMGIEKNGQLWVWGYNGVGQLGLGDTTFRCTPHSIRGTKRTFCNIGGGYQHSTAIDNEGLVWCWGYNSKGQLGINSITNKCYPNSILGARKTFCQISSGFEHTVTIDNHGQVWSWGHNNSGHLGNNSTTSRRTPVSIHGARKTFCQISAGEFHSLGLDNHGEVWGWGFNFYGQLGDNSTASKRTPVSILGNKKTFCQISAGYENSLGLDNHNQLWSWGYNNLGQLGDGTTIGRCTPVLISI